MILTSIMYILDSSGINSRRIQRCTFTAICVNTSYLFTRSMWVFQQLLQHNNTFLLKFSSLSNKWIRNEKGNLCLWRNILPTMWHFKNIALIQSENCYSTFVNVQRRLYIWHTNCLRDEAICSKSTIWTVYCNAQSTLLVNSIY